MSVRVELRRFKLVAFEVEDRLDNFLIVFVGRALNHLRALGCLCPAFGNVDFDKVVARRRVYCVVVHLNDRIALSAERFFSHVLHILDSLVVGHNLRVNAEERRLQNGVGSAAQSQIRRNLDSVNNVKIYVLFSDILLNLCGQKAFKRFNRGCRGVYKEGTAVLNVARHIVAGNVGGVRALNEVCAVNQIFRLNGRVAETEVRYGYTARFLGIVEEVRLRVLVRMVADNFN